MIIVRVILVGCCIAISHVILHAHSDSLAVDSLRKRAAQVLRTSDSLRAVWDEHWKRSDSLRIESMYVRMRSDSLQRLAQDLLGRIAGFEQKGTDTIQSANDVLPTAEVARHVTRAVKSVRSTDPGSGRTHSDSVTATVLRFKSDTGSASFYADKFHGRKTASGEVFNMNDRTCAHRWLPFNTLVKVKNLANGKEVVVRVTDRGPWKHQRLIDLSKQAAKDIDMIQAGVARVSIQVLSNSDSEPKR